MATITFDTLKFANTLKDAGVPPAQAEAEAIALSEVLEVNLKELVTKEDLHREVESLRREIMTGFAQVDSRFIQLEQRLIIKLGGLIALSIGIVAALVKLL
jgi:2-phosphoglycerate kinase